MQTRWSRRLVLAAAVGVSGLYTTASVKADPNDNAARRAERVADKAARIANKARMKGQFVRTQGDNQILVRTPDGRQVTVYGTPQTTYRIDNRDVTLTELREGTPIDVGYDVREDKYYATDITSGTTTTTTTVEEQSTPEPGATKSIRGTVRSPAQLVIRTADGDSVTVQLDGQEPVNATVESRNGQWVLRSLNASATSRVESDADVRTGTERRRDQTTIRERNRNDVRNEPVPSDRRDAVREGARDGRDAVREGVRDGVRESTNGARDAVDGVREGVREGARDAVREGVRDAVRGATGTNRD